MAKKSLSGSDFKAPILLDGSAGTSGQVLTSQGSSASPIWSSASGGSGTVTSVALSTPVGLTVSGSPITTSGTIAISLASGYSIPTTSSQLTWDTAYGWGNHASAGYLTTSSALATYAPLASPTFSGTVSGITKSMVGLGNVDNTSDANKPVSTATQTALDLKANLSGSNTLTGALLLTLNTGSTSTTTGTLRVSGGVGITENVYIGGNLDVVGNITFGGTSTILNGTSLSIQDPLIYLSDNQYSADAVDIGIYGAYGVSGHNTEADHYHTGLVRKAGGGWHLISAGAEPTSNTVSLTSVNYDSLKIGSLVVTDAATTRTNLGLSTVASTGSYSDLSGKPSLATVATTGVYSDLSGKPSLATVATSGSYTDLSSKPTLGTMAAAATTDYAALAGATFTGAVALPKQLNNTIVSGYNSASGAFNQTNRVIMVATATGSTAPTTRPDGTTALSAGDVWISW